MNIEVGEEFRSWIEGLTFLILSTIYKCLCVCVLGVRGLAV